MWRNCNCEDFDPSCNTAHPKIALTAFLGENRLLSVSSPVVNLLTAPQITPQLGHVRGFHLQSVSAAVCERENLLTVAFKISFYQPLSSNSYCAERKDSKVLNSVANRSKAGSSADPAAGQKGRKAPENPRKSTECRCLGQAVQNEAAGEKPLCCVTDCLPGLISVCGEADAAAKSAQWGLW